MDTVLLVTWLNHNSVAWAVYPIGKHDWSSGQDSSQVPALCGSSRQTGLHQA